MVATVSNTNIIERARIHCGLARLQTCNFVGATDTDTMLDNDRLSDEQIDKAKNLIALFDGWVREVASALEERGPLDILWFTHVISEVSHCNLSGWQAERWRTAGFLTTELQEQRGPNHAKTWLYGVNEWLKLVEANTRALIEPMPGEDKPRRSGPLAPAFIYFLKGREEKA